LDVMRVLIHYNKIKASLAEKDNGGTVTKGDYLDDAIRKEINDTRRRLEKMNGKNEKLQDDICELNKTLHEMMEKIDMEQVQTDDLLRDFQNEINNEKNLITERAQTIDQLGGMLKAQKKSVF
jgi:predicted RNase H-like nuclease (RuvC/YqgF family)